jgi:hypothetical protein
VNRLQQVHVHRMCFEQIHLRGIIRIEYCVRSVVSLVDSPAIVAGLNESLQNAAV